MSQHPIDLFLAKMPKGIPFITSWIQDQGFSHSQLQYFRKLQKFESFGRGVLSQYGDTITPFGAIYALQTQTKLSLHIGALTALYLHSKDIPKQSPVKLQSTKSNIPILFYNDSKKQEQPLTIILLGSTNTQLPGWFKTHPWNPNVSFFSKNPFFSDIGIITKTVQNLQLRISSPLRSIFEAIRLSPTTYPLDIYPHLMTSIADVQSSEVQLLLEECNSIRVKRLFLVLAELTQMPWFSNIDLATIDLGSGKRSFVRRGVLHDKFAITIPNSWLKPPQKEQTIYLDVPEKISQIPHRQSTPLLLEEYPNNQIQEQVYIKIEEIKIPCIKSPTPHLTKK